MERPSLLLLPPEITDLIFSTIPIHDSTKLRLLCKSYNHRFQSHFRTKIFTYLRLNTHPSTIHHLSKITQSGVGPWIQHITFSSKPLSKLNPNISLSSPSDDHENDYNTSSKYLPPPPPPNDLTEILNHLPNLRLIDFDGSCNITNWKEIISSISKSQVSAIETLRSPPGKMLVSGLLLSPSEMEQYSYGSFDRLKTLEMHTEGMPMQNFWSWISIIGRNCLEDLTIRNSRNDIDNDINSIIDNHHQNSISANPDHIDNFLPQTFNLPHLKRLHLDDLYLTVKDITNHLLPSHISSQFEKLNLTKCHLLPNDPAQNWFIILTHLKTHTFPKLTYLKLSLSGYYNGITTYDLPDLKFNTNEIIISGAGKTAKPWNQRNTKCEVKLRSGEWNTYVVRKSLWEELDRVMRDGLGEEVFWESLTNGKWTSDRATRLKRIIKVREVSRLEYGERGDPRLWERIRAISREVDSDCEDVWY
ncbi:hypothetical protein TWF970_005001 [Orbilia oligospora]|uniref:F-box domain-containing protein n=1 Tax=Orbilia oligospora TaxID=2813651 RepID=A0A7C8RCN5_ORBOL|nr:hypothetical protein TWF970_005001 [Orbilia oligospora]